MIDAQLQEALFDFQRTTGVVATIKGEGGSKSGELAAALSGDKKIVVCTIQTFPFALKRCANWRRPGQALRGDRRRGAQLADRRGGGEAEGGAVARGAEGTGGRRRGQHRRHAGGADGGAGRATRASPTSPSPPRRRPRRWNCSARAPIRTQARRRRQSARAVPRLFDAAGHRGEASSSTCCRTTRRTSWPSSWRTTARRCDDKEVERSAALKGIMGWVRLHPYNIAQKVADRRRALPRERRAAARRARPRRWWWSAAAWRRCAGKLAIDKYIKDRGYKIGTLVAFSGEVNDKESGPDPFTETSQTLNPNLQGPRHPRSVQEATSIRSCWSPTSSRPASTSRCCAACTSTSGWPASRPCRRCRGSTAPIPARTRPTCWTS